MCLMPIAAWAQNGVDFGDLCTKYSGREGYSTIEMSGKMFKMINGATVDMDDELSMAIDNIKSLQILIAQRANKEFSTDVDNMLKKMRYEVMTTVNDHDKKVLFFIRESDEKQPTVSNFLMRATSGQSDVLMSITGSISIKQISQLTKITVKE